MTETDPAMPKPELDPCIVSKMWEGLLLVARVPEYIFLQNWVDQYVPLLMRILARLLLTRCQINTVQMVLSKESVRSQHELFVRAMETYLNHHRTLQ